MAQDLGQLKPTGFELVMKYRREFYLLALLILQTVSGIVELIEPNESLLLHFISHAYLNMKYTVYLLLRACV